MSEKETIQCNGEETNESNKLTKDINSTNNRIQNMSSQHLLNRNKRDSQCIPGKKSSNKQIINDTKKNHTVSSIMNSLYEGTAKIKYSNDSNIILVLGLSGAGKSTLTQYLFGNNSNLMAVAKKNFKCQATGDFYIEDTGNKVGHNALLSHTEVPDLVIDPETNTTIYDCPGFSDTRDPEHDISGAYFIKAVSENATALKFIFVVNYNSITLGANREEFMILARHATNMIHNISKYNESIALIATKIKDDKSDEERIISITDFLQEVRQTLNESNEEPNVQSFIDILLTTSDPDNQDYTKIACMPKFDTEGRLIDLPSVQTHKKSISSVIHNNVNFTKIDKTDVRPTISSKSVYYIDGLVNELSHQIWVNIQIVVQKVQVFYDYMIQDMLDTIYYFNEMEIVVIKNPLEAKSFVIKLNTGLSAMTEVIENIKSKTTLHELSKYIMSSAMITEVELSQDLVSNITTQHGYLKYLLSVHEPKNLFNVDEISILFTNLKNHLEISINHFNKNVSDVADRVTNIIVLYNNNIMNDIHKHFFRLAEITLMKTKISSLMKSGHLELSKIRDLANSPDITYKCIGQIRRTISDFRFERFTINSSEYIYKKTSEMEKRLIFLQTLNNESVNSYSLKCMNEIDRVIFYLDESSKWYDFLIRLFEKLSGYTVQKNITTCNDLSKSIMSQKPPARAGDVIPKLFVERCFSVNDYNTAGVDNVILDEIRLDDLKRIISQTLNHNSNYSCDLKSPNHIIMKGHYIKLSDLNNCPQIEHATLVEIFALIKIFIDVDIDKTGEKFSLCIIAPVWEIYGRHKIKLDGKPGDAYTDTARKGYDLSLQRVDDENGAPGLPGGPGGNFLGIGANFINSNDLSVSADGGNGGPGQDGGDGFDGLDDIECPSTIPDEDFPGKDFCISFRWTSLAFLFDEGCTAHSMFNGFSLDIRVIDIKNQEVTCHPIKAWPIRGGSGGNGGKGGVGGYGGNITVIAKDNQSINLRNQVGKTGSDGKGGVGGKAGKSGKNLVFELIPAYPSIVRENSTRFQNSGLRYSRGENGINGYNTNNQKNPKKPVSQLGHQSINAYKTFFRNYLSNNSNDEDWKKFLDSLEDQPSK